MTHLSALAAMIERGEAPLFRAEFALCLSVNDAYGNVQKRAPDRGGKHKKAFGRGKTEGAKAWHAAAMQELLTVRRPWEPISCPVFAVYTIPPNESQKRDCANYEKLASDMLVDAGVLEDDSLILCNVQQFGTIPKGRMLAEIYGAAITD